MRPVKRVLLGSAAGIFAVAGAQAADLPVKAKPVEYVKVCSLYGAGFWYVPGTDTCIKVGAYVKFQVEYNMSGTGPFMPGAAAGGVGASDAGGRANRFDTSPFTIAGRQGGVSFDVRTQTEYGTLRSFYDIIMNVGGASANNGGSAQLAAVTPVNTRAFIQFAGFTAGRMRSFFDMYFQGTYAFSGQRFGADTSPNGIIGLAYTWQLGGGLSASLSLEDNDQVSGGRGRFIVNSTSNPFAVAGTEIYNDKGVQFFDPVANLRLDQTWGFAGVSASLHDASGGYYGRSGAGGIVEGNGHPGDKFGWAVSPAFLISSPFGLQGDAIAGQAVYSKGAAGYAFANANAPATVFGSGMNLGFGLMADGIFSGSSAANGTGIELTTVWSANAAYEHRWNPQWRTSVYGGYVNVEYDGAAASMICLTLKNIAAGTGCSPNWSMNAVGSRTLWNPVPDLDVGFDVVWYHFNTSFNGATVNLPAGFAGAKPSGNYSVSNQDALAAVFRVQRNFLY